MEQKRIEQLLRALEIIADIIPPTPSDRHDVPTKRFFKMRWIAAIALRDPDRFQQMEAELEKEGWMLPLPYDSIKQLQEENEDHTTE